MRSIPTRPPPPTGFPTPARPALSATSGQAAMVRSIRALRAAPAVKPPRDPEHHRGEFAATSGSGFTAGPAPMAADSHPPVTAITAAA